VEGPGPSTGTTTPAKSSAVMRRGSLSLWVGIVPLCLRLAGVGRSGRLRITRSRRSRRRGIWRKGIEEVAVHKLLQRAAGLRIDGNGHQEGAREEIPDDQAADEQHGKMREDRRGDTGKLGEIFVGAGIVRVIVVGLELRTGSSSHSDLDSELKPAPACWRRLRARRRAGP